MTHGHAHHLHSWLGPAGAQNSPVPNFGISPYRIGTNFALRHRGWVTGDLVISVTDNLGNPLVGITFVVVVSGNDGSSHSIPGTYGSSRLRARGTSLIILGLGLFQHGGEIHLLGFDSTRVVIQGACQYIPRHHRVTEGEHGWSVRLLAQQASASRSVSAQQEPTTSITINAPSVSVNIGSQTSLLHVQVNPPTSSRTTTTVPQTVTTTAPVGIDEFDHMRQI